MLRGYIQLSFPLIAGQSSYTIGDGVTYNFNTPYGKPLDIRDAQVEDSSHTLTNIDIISNSDWNNVEDKLISSARPTMLSYFTQPTQYTATTPYGTVNVTPIPDASTAYTLHFSVQAELAQFSSTADIVKFEDPYMEAIKFNLAKRLWFDYWPMKPIPADLKEMAKTTKHRIMTINYDAIRAKIEVPGKRGSFNVFTGEFK